MSVVGGATKEKTAGAAGVLSTASLAPKVKFDVGTVVGTVVGGWTKENALPRASTASLLPKVKFDVGGVTAAVAVSVLTRVVIAVSNFFLWEVRPAVVISSNRLF